MEMDFTYLYVMMKDQIHSFVNAIEEMGTNYKLRLLKKKKKKKKIRKKERTKIMNEREYLFENWWNKIE